MKSVKLFLGILLLAIILLTSTTQFTACTKTKTEYVHDTTTVVDTLYDLNDGLVAYYNFTNGSLKDSSVYGNDITFSNATKTTDRFGNPNGAYLFDGNSSYMKIPNSASLNPSNLTLMAIFKVNGFYPGPCHGNELISKGWPDGINGFYLLRFSDFPPDCSGQADTTKEMFLGGITGVGGQTDGIYVKTGQWYNLIFTYDGIVSKLYLNGELKKTWDGAAPNFAPNTHDLFLGKHEDPQFPYYFNGVIDDVRIYNEALPLYLIKKLSN